MSIIDLLINRPSEIRQYLSHGVAADEPTEQGHTNACFVRELLRETEYKDRISHLEKCELVRVPYELSLDFNYTNVIERCVWKDETSMVTADIILDYLFKQEYLHENQQLGVMFFQLFLNHPQKSNCFFNFLGTD